MTKGEGREGFAGGPPAGEPLGSRSPGRGSAGEGRGAVARGYRVTGRVQGVGFRFWTRRTARALGLGGYVRNLPDGSVEVQAVGPEEALARLEAALATGPPAAEVDRVERLPGKASVGRDEFEIEA